MPRQRDPTLLAAMGKRLQAVRRDRGWTQERLAEAIGIEPISLSRWETGDRAVSLTVLAEAARVLGVGLGDLLDVERAEPPPAEEPVIGEATSILRSLDGEGRDLAIRLLREVARKPRK